MSVQSEAVLGRLEHFLRRVCASLMQFLVYTDNFTTARSSSTNDDIAVLQTANLATIQAVYLLLTAHV
jgi:hypothetical protein